MSGGPAEEAIIEARERSGWRGALAGPFAAREVRLTGRVRRGPPSQRAGLLVADAVNNLRSALDHAVWRLSVQSASPPFPVPRRGSGSEWRSVAWPIALEERSWHSMAARRLRFVDRQVWPEVERLQPFRRRTTEPERDEFAILDELWNVYKHRHLPLTQVWVGLGRAASLLNRVQVFDAPRGYADGLRKQLREHAYEIVLATGRQPFTDGVELGTVREAKPPYSWCPEVHLDAHLLVEVSFEEGPPAYGAPVQGALKQLRNAVGGAIKAIEPYALGTSKDGP